MPFTFSFWLITGLIVYGVLCSLSILAFLNWYSTKRELMVKISVGLLVPAFALAVFMTKLNPKMPDELSWFIRIALMVVIAILGIILAISDLSDRRATKLATKKAKRSEFLEYSKKLLRRLDYNNEITEATEIKPPDMISLELSLTKKFLGINCTLISSTATSVYSLGFFLEQFEKRYRLKQDD